MEGQSVMYPPVTVCTSETSPPLDLPLTLKCLSHGMPISQNMLFYVTSFEALAGCSVCVCVKQRGGYYSSPLVMKTQRPPALADS